MRKLGYLCVSALFVVFIVLSVNVVITEAREAPKPLKTEIVEPVHNNPADHTQNKIEVERRFNAEQSIIRQLPATLETEIHIQHLPLPNSDNGTTPVTPY